jgi:hypothetical protein
VFEEQLRMMCVAVPFFYLILKNYASGISDGVFDGLLCLWKIEVLYHYYSGGIPY